MSTPSFVAWATYWSKTAFNVGFTVIAEENNTVAIWTKIVDCRISCGFSIDSTATATKNRIFVPFGIRTYPRAPFATLHRSYVLPITFLEFGGFFISLKFFQCFHFANFYHTLPHPALP